MQLRDFSQLYLHSKYSARDTMAVPAPRAWLAQLVDAGDVGAIEVPNGHITIGDLIDSGIRVNDAHWMDCFIEWKELWGKFHLYSIAGNTKVNGFRVNKNRGTQLDHEDVIEVPKRTGEAMRFRFCLLHPSPPQVERQHSVAVAARAAAAKICKEQGLADEIRCCYIGHRRGGDRRTQLQAELPASEDDLAIFRWAAEWIITVST